MTRIVCRVTARLALAGMLVSGTAAGDAAPFPVEETTIAQVHAAYLSHASSAVEVVSAHLDRIAAYDKTGPILNSIITVNPRALEEAKALDEALAASGKLSGPLHGIPVIVKDNIDVAGMPMTSGFQGWRNYVPHEDAPLVRKIKAAGGIVIAKASLSEFARGGGDNINSVLSGFARNPYNPAYATGGSSGGTGAALAASFGIVGIGTDTGGSVRMPAAHTALAGLRPTVGLVSRTGLVPLCSIRDTAGPMARTVGDMAILLDVIAGVDPLDTATRRAQGHIASSYAAALKADALRGARLGVLRQVFAPGKTDPRILERFEAVLAELRAAGAEIVDPFTVPELDTLPRAPQTAARFKDDLTRFIAAHPGIPYPSVQAIADSELLHPLHQTGFERAATALPVDEDPETTKGLETERLHREAFTRAMDSGTIDAVIFPTWAQLPALNGDRNTQLTTDPQPGAAAGPVALRSSLTFVGSTLQWPALSVPMGSIEGLPVGLQILGRAWDESRIISYAYAYEQGTHHRLAPPTTPPLGESFAGRFVGVWRLVSVLERDATSGEETQRPGGGSSGQLVYAANGRLSVQIMRLDRSEESEDPAAGFSSYFGRWELRPAEGCVVHHQEGNLRVASVGAAAKRYYRFDAAGRLFLATPPRKRDDGREISSIFVWEREASG